MAELDDGAGELEYWTPDDEEGVDDAPDDRAGPEDAKEELTPEIPGSADTMLSSLQASKPRMQRIAEY